MQLIQLYSLGERCIYWYSMLQKPFYLALLLLLLLPFTLSGQIFHTDDFSTSSIWTLNTSPASINPALGSNDPAFNPWVINSLNFFSPSGPISGNSLKVSIQPGTDFAGLGLTVNMSGYDPFNQNEPNVTDAVALQNTDISTLGRFGITLEFDYQSGGWLGDDYGTVLYSVDGGASWIELDNSVPVNYTSVGANNAPASTPGSAQAAPPNATTANAFSNIDGVLSGSLWHRASLLLPATCDNIANLRLGFRWRNIDQITNSPDYLGVSFNIDNIALRVNPPTASFSWTPPAPCANVPVTFDPATSTPGGGAAITGWIWTFSSGSPATSTLQNPVISWATAGMDTVTLQVINNLGDTSLLASQYIFINDCAPKANILTSNAVCQDSLITFQDLSSNTSATFAPVTWAWAFTGGTPATANTQGPHNVSFSTLGPHDVTLTVTNNFGSDDTTISVNVVDCSCAALASSSPIFVEDFDGNGGAGSNWVTAPLNQNTGTNGANANLWYISDQENGNLPPNCGSAGGGNLTLHLSSSTVGDLGAAYDTGCEPGCAICDILPAFCSYTSTDKRSQSQNISSVGFANLTLTFDYIENGQGVTDNAIVEFSTDGGATWAMLIDPPKTALGCAPQGMWTAFSVPLPASCNNIPNLRIAFRWQNDGDGVGTDPSFAVNNIQISPPSTPLPFSWIGGTSNDWHLGANWSGGLVPTMTDDIVIPALSSLCPTCVMPEVINGNAEARDICNFGRITIHDTPTKRTLTVWRALLNQGAITTTSADPVFDVLMRGIASTYAGTGTNIDTDYQVQSGQTTLLADISCRSFQTSADFVWGPNRITVKRNFRRTTGTFTTSPSSTLYMDGPGTGFDTNPAQIFSSNINVTIPNIIVNKPSGIVTIGSNAIHSISQRLTIVRGILDAGTVRLTGAGDLYMMGGELRLARTGVVAPQIVGGYFLTGGLIQLYGTGNQRLRGNRNYYDLEFANSGVKTLNDNANVQHELRFNQTPGAGNYVDAATFVLHVLNTSPSAVVHTSGHVVGNLARDILNNGTYRWHVGSDGMGTVTFFEPLDIQPVNLAGTNTIMVAFNKSTPSPLMVTPPLTELGGVFTTLETEGYWEVNPDAQPSAGTFTVTEHPSPAWIFSSAAYTQVRQDAFGMQWTWNGSNRITGLKRKDYPSFSNFGIASSAVPLPTDGLTLAAELLGNQVKLDWVTTREVNTARFEVERSLDGQQFVQIGEVAAGGNLPAGADYASLDTRPAWGANFYRLKQIDQDGRFAYSNTVLVQFGEELGIQFFPNPARNEVKVSYQGAELIHLVLSNTLGQQIATYKISGNQTLQVGGLPRGIYLLTARTAKGKPFTQKLILE
ncbi:MAG TPA: T9SS type A sorting domain-containing protein [Bacteroidetes bacterium]|nr:T9SS type A sorting domain-containing protein [Bacteroidota bacterium]